ncbi:unnamed protein product [Hymenolepis diminuta]|uniref:HTH La-type RNA-binding domain-containing protein n=2 Tax=Hymenolepis diminuta TaxID=6216 RepID=A0A564XVP4_HYMDI|nr:unnamed protein product [Hymenolepis diminuta]
MGRDNSTGKKTMRKDEKRSESTGEHNRTRVESATCSAPVPELSKVEQSSHLVTNAKATSSKQQADLSVGSKDQKQKSGKKQKRNWTEISFSRQRHLDPNYVASCSADGTSLRHFEYSRTQWGSRSFSQNPHHRGWNRRGPWNKGPTGFAKQSTETNEEKKQIGENSVWVDQRSHFPASRGWNNFLRHSNSRQNHQSACPSTSRSDIQGSYVRGQKVLPQLSKSSKEKEVKADISEVEKQIREDSLKINQLTRFRGMAVIQNLKYLFQLPNSDKIPQSEAEQKGGAQASCAPDQMVTDKLPNTSRRMLFSKDYTAVSGNNPNWASSAELQCYNPSAERPPVTTYRQKEHQTQKFIAHDGTYAGAKSATQARRHGPDLVKLDELAKRIKKNPDKVRAPKAFRANEKVMKAIAPHVFPIDVDDEDNTQCDRIVYVGDELYYRVVNGDYDRFLRFPNRAAYISHHVRYYFSSANLLTDKHLRNLLTENEGVCPFKDLLNFQRLKMVNTEATDLVDCVKSIENVELVCNNSSTPTGYRLSIPLPEQHKFVSIAKGDIKRSCLSNSSNSDSTKTSKVPVETNFHYDFPGVHNFFSIYAFCSLSMPQISSLTIPIETHFQPAVFAPMPQPLSFDILDFMPNQFPFSYSNAAAGAQISQNIYPVQQNVKP